MVRGETLSVQFGFCTGGTHSSANPTGRVLELREPDVARFARGLFAVIDASDEARAHAHEVLQRSFRRESAPVVPAGQEERYVAGVLESLSAVGLGRGRQSVIIAVWIGRDMLLGSLGSSRAYLSRGDGNGITDITHTMSAIESSDARLMRLHPQTDDTLVLAGGGLSAGISLHDLQQTVLYSPDGLSLRDQAAWLVNVASARSGLGASVAIVRFSAAPSLRSAFRRAGHSSKWRVTGILTAALVTATGLASAGLVLTSVLAQSTPGKRVIPTATPVVLTPYPEPQLVKPLGTLASSQTGQVNFCWHDRVPARSGQLEIQIGSSRMEPSLSPAAFRVLPHGLQCTLLALHSGNTYQWRVSMGAPGYTARWTEWQTFRIAAAPKPRLHPQRRGTRIGRKNPHHSTKPAKRR